MIWDNWGAFWAMGGYGLYVWGSFGATLACIVGEVWMVRRQRRQIVARLRRLQRFDSQ